jgi:hypothetical protein
MHDWKDPSHGAVFFSISIGVLLWLILDSFYLPAFNQVNQGIASGTPGYFSFIYGPTWGLSFGWYALLLAGILGIIHEQVKKMIKKSKEEAEEAFLA